MSAKDIVAIACADLHLSLTPPPARRGEKNWLEAQALQLRELGDLAEEHGVPILCAGDVFDHWRVVPELINWAIDELPDMWAIPGQHDMPFHDAGQIEKSAYWTMVKVGCIHSLREGIIGYPLQRETALSVVGFPWGTPIEACKPIKKGVCIALVHDYLYCDKPPFDASLLGCVKNNSRFAGWSTVISGDNHIPFQHKNVFNCGSFYNRKSDEAHKVRVGLIHSDGSVLPYALTTANNQSFMPTISEASVPMDQDMEDFLNSTRELNQLQLDYVERLQNLLHTLSDPKLTRILAETIEYVKNK